MEEVRFSTDKGSIFGMASGVIGAPVIMGIHGWSQRNGWHTWQRLMEPLAGGGYRVICVDMPGWGQSDPWRDEVLSDDEAVMAVLTVLDAEHSRQAVLMGKSWGGGIAIKTALEYPDRTNQLILTAPAYREPDKLGGLQQPTLLAWAIDDPVIPVKYAEYFVQKAPGVELVTYPTGGHSAGHNNAEDFSERILEFLKSEQAT